MNKTAYVYAIRNAGSGDCYVGCTIAKSIRWARHRYLLRSGQHHAKRLQDLWNTHGEGAFSFEVLERIPYSTKETRVSRELFWIESVGTLNTHVSNGGTFTIRPEDAEERRRLSLARMAADPDLVQFLTERGKELAELARSPESRAAMSHHTKRRWKDPEEAKRLRAGLERRWQDPEEHRRAAERITSDDYKEVRKQRAASLAATWADPEKNAKLKESRAKRWADPEAKERQAAKMRAIWAARRGES